MSFVLLAVPADEAIEVILEGPVGTEGFLIKEAFDAAAEADLSARALVTDQPAKFAATEVTWKTRDHNPEVIGGLIDDSGDVRFGIAVPVLDSILVGYSPNAVVRGLTDFAANARPSPRRGSDPRW